MLRPHFSEGLLQLYIGEMKNGHFKNVQFRKATPFLFTIFTIPTIVGYKNRTVNTNFEPSKKR